MEDLELRKMKESLDKAINIAGSQSALARMINVKPQAVNQWVKQGFVSRKSAKKVSRAVGIPLEQL